MGAFRNSGVVVNGTAFVPKISTTGDEAMKNLYARNNTLCQAIRHAMYAGVFAATLGLAVPTELRAQTANVASFDIAEQPLSAALKLFAEQSGMQLLYRQESVSGLTVRPIKGQFDKRQALQKMLGNADLEVIYSSENAATIRPRGREPASQEGNTNGELLPNNPALIVADGAQSAETEARSPGSARDLDAVVVTGTRIRGGTTPSPVITIGSERIREEGFSDLGEVIRSIPQNFGGGQNPGINAGATGGGVANQNITGGASLNLRGLGPDASLTLLNGRRMSYGSFAQMVDISAIPVDAVERIEIVADGASAIYGSDAVGGVGNVVLKREFDGVTVGARYGGTTDGGLFTREYTATAGTTWFGGGLIATWKKSSSDPIYSVDRDYTRDMYTPSTLYQGAELRSGLISAYQTVGDHVELRLDALRTEREILTDMAYPTSYERYTPATTTSLVSPSVEVALPGDWKLSVGGSWGRDRTEIERSVVTIATGAASVSGGCYCNESRVYEVGAEGPLFSLGGGDARLALGAGYRHNAFLQTNTIGMTTVDGEVSSRFAYTELDLPLIGPSQNIPGVQRLTLSGAMRAEDYDNLGEVFTPKFGVVYGPNPDYTLKASWGKSFKTPTLSLQYSAQNLFLFPAATLGGRGYAANATVLLLAGGNPDLAPERARTWSASLAFHPEALAGLEAELTWFDVDYTDRVERPLNPGQALSNPNYADLIIYAPTAAEQAALLASYALINATGTSYVSENVVAIAPNLFINMSRQRVRGLDLSGSYRIELGDSRLTIRGSASRLANKRQMSPAEPEYDLTGTLFYPSEFNGRFGAVWSKSGVTASVFGNYKSGVTNEADDREGGSFTTIDANLRYDTSGSYKLLSGLSFDLAVQNLLNRAPPLYGATSRTFASYDSANYSAIGRYLSFSISKHW